MNRQNNLLEEIKDEPTALREIHEIRLKMYEERIASGLSFKEWAKLESEKSKETINKYKIGFITVPDTKYNGSSEKPAISRG